MTPQENRTEPGHSLTGRESISKPLKRVLDFTPPLSTSTSPLQSKDWVFPSCQPSAGSHTVAQNWHHHNKDRIISVPFGSRDVCNPSRALAEQSARGSQAQFAAECNPQQDRILQVVLPGTARRHLSFPGHTLEQLSHNF